MRKVHALTLVVVGTAALLQYSGARAASTEAISVRDPALTPYATSRASQGAEISANGAYIGFSSASAEFVANDTNGRTDAFVRNRVTGAVEKVSVAPDGKQANSDSYVSALSADGRFVSLTSYASNLVSSDHNAAADAFLHDRWTHSTYRISVSSSGQEAMGNSGSIGVSDDGRYVAFNSTATNLLPGASTPINRPYVRDRATGITSFECLSSAGEVADSECSATMLSADGRYLVMTSAATNLVSGDTNGKTDVFVRDRKLRTTTRVSLGASGAEGDNDSFSGVISTDGRYVAFTSTATNFIQLGDSSASNVYLRDLTTGLTIQVNSAADPYWDYDAEYPSISLDGRYIAYGASFPSAAYLFDRITGQRTTVSTGGPIFFWPEVHAVPSISGDGKFIAYTSESPSLVPYDSNEWSDVFVYSRVAGTNSLVSAAKVLSSTPINGSTSAKYALSSNGRQAAFNSLSSLLVPSDTNGWEDIFVRNRDTRKTTRVSLSSNGTQASYFQREAAISGDGRVVAFISESDLVPDDNNYCADVFVRDLKTNALSRVSVASDGSEGDFNPGSCHSFDPAMSSDGRFVTFTSMATGIVPERVFGFHIYLHDRVTHTTELVSVARVPGDYWAYSSSSSLTPDGRFVVFDSDSPNLVSGDTNEQSDIFLRDRKLKTTTLISRPANGQSNGYSTTPTISPDGCRIAFTSNASNLVAGDTNGVTDVYVYDRCKPKMTRVSSSTNGTQGNESSSAPVLSASGRYVAFSSYADNLVANDRNNSPDIFVRDMQTGSTTLASISSTGTQINGGSFTPSINSDGSAIVFTSGATNVVTSDLNETSDVFVRQRW